MTITINKIKYVRTEVTRMVMKRAHELKYIMHKITMSDALIMAWSEVKRQIINKQYARIRNLSKEQYAALTIQEKIDWIDHKIFDLSMKDRWDSKDREINNRLNAERNALVCHDTQAA